MLLATSQVLKVDSTCMKEMTERRDHPGIKVVSVRETDGPESDAGPESCLLWGVPLR